MFISRKLIGLLAAAMLTSTTLMAKDYKHSDLIESFAVLPAVTQATVSPDGKRVIIRRATTKDGDYILEVRKTRDLKKSQCVLVQNTWKFRTLIGSITT